MTLIDEQIAIENNAHYEAKARYEKYKMKEDEGFVRNAASDRLLSLVVPKYALMLEQWWQPGVGKGGGKLRSMKNEFRNMPLDSIGFSIAVIRTTITRLFQKKPEPLTTIAEKVWLSVHLENSYTEFKEYGKNDGALSEQEKADWRALSRKLITDTKDKNSYKRRKVLEYARETFLNVSDDEPVNRVNKGLALINLLLQLKVTLRKGEQEAPLIQVINLKRSKERRLKALRFSPEVQKVMHDADVRIESSLFAFYPMVVEPTPWEGMFGGGYVTPRGRGNLPLIKSPNVRLYKDSHIGQPVLDAVNIIQATPWNINRKIFGVMDFCTNKGLEIGKLPVGAKEFKLPERLEDDEWDKLTRDEKSELISRRKQIHEEADSTSSKILSFRLKLSMARRFLKYERLYYPHTFDFRGRIYPIAAAVNPQSDKFGQALLQFAEAKPLGETGRKWLAIHGANTFGLDSESFPVRQQFAEDQEASIIAAAANPLREREFWGEAEDPFGFLAFCCEWADMLKMKDQTQYKSRLPIKLDATSSGLQHYSAIFRDEVGAKATNLMDGDRSDIYALVAEESKKILLSDIASEPSDEEKQWKRSFLSCLNRSICKPATMCLPYGVTLFGATDAIADLHRDGKLEGAYLSDITPRERLRRIRHLASIVMQGVGEVVKSAVIGMDWLKDLQQEAIRNVDEGVIKCETPLGFPFYQQYYKTQTRRVEQFLGGFRIRLNVGKFTPKIDKVKAGNAIAPNFIHSQDATHLLKSALMAHKEGITSFSYIHDSFGVHAADTERFRSIIREAFVWLYELDTFGRLRSQWEKQFNATELPPVPYEQYGTFDIKDCLKSSYMFN